MIHWPWCNLVVRETFCLGVLLASRVTFLTYKSLPISHFDHLCEKRMDERSARTAMRRRIPMISDQVIISAMLVKPRRRKYIKPSSRVSNNIVLKNILYRDLFLKSNFWPVFCERARWMELLVLRWVEDFRLFQRRTTMQRLWKGYPQCYNEKTQSWTRRQGDYREGMHHMSHGAPNRLFQPSGGDSGRIQLPVCFLFVCSWHDSFGKKEKPTEDR